MNYHLFVLVHGLWGNKSHLLYIEQEIEKARSQLSPGEELVVYRTSDNEGYKTLDGIDVCGLRVAKEIKLKINSLNGLGDDGDGQEGDKQHVVKLSVVGYSLGGLISRYAVGVLYHQGYFNEIQPVNFTTFCTPHVGALQPGTSVSIKLFNWLVPNLLSSSGKQMFLSDTSGANNQPLLLSMSNPSSIFYKALEFFKYRNLYANAINDKRTSWWTAGISTIDPFMKIDETSKLNDMAFKFCKGYESIVIDSNSWFTISTIPIEKGISPILKTSSSSNFWARKFKWLTVGMNLLIVVPLWVIWFIISGLMETFKSHRRINHTFKDYHSFFTTMTDWVDTAEELLQGSDELDEEEGELTEKDDDDSKSTNGSIKAMNFVDSAIDQHFHDKTDTFMESVYDAISSKDAEESAKIDQYHIETYDIASAPIGTENQSSSTEADSLLPPSIKTTITELTLIDKANPLSDNEVLKVFTEKLTDAQCQIIKNLNTLQWDKYPVLIRHTKSTHSAAIVRNMEDAELFEGKTVIKHWIQEVLRLE